MLPLKGYRVIEFCEVAAGPFCGMLLADMGADVIKVERPEGDGMRQWPPLSNGYSENFASLNRNKRSVVLDLKSEADRAAARQLILSADAVIENYRPGFLEKYGLDHKTLSAEKPALIYCSISAFGQTGPRAKEGGFDLTLQAIAGVMSVTGESDGAPVKSGVPLCDFVSGLYGAFSVVSALHSTRSGNKGNHLDVSMLGATLAVAALQTSEYFGTGRNPRKLGSAHPRNAPYQAFRARDDYFAMAAGNNKLWRSVCEATDSAELLEDVRFTTTAERARHQSELKVLLEAKFAVHTSAHWVKVFSDHGVPCGPINTYSDILADPQVAHMGWIKDVTLPSGKETKTFISPLVVDGQNMGIRLAPPALGAHTQEVLASLDAKPPQNPHGSKS